ncbi:MAG: MFS transporter, partial [Pantoea sp.]|nr:MFS transporter [Pantoea sp.]
NLAQRLPHAADPVQQIMSAPSREALSSETLHHMVQAIATSLHWVFVVALVIALFALGMAWMMPRQRPEQAE